MKSYRVVIEPSAWKQIMALSGQGQERILDLLESLELTPRPSGCRKLAGAESVYRVRSGNYRVIYQVRDAQLVVLVVKVGHRRDVYR